MSEQANIVPSHYYGVWQRLARRNTPDGEMVDDLGIIYWMQSRYLHIDMRVPKTREGYEGLTSFEDCSDEQLRLLAIEQEGFCGHTTVEADICTWDRHIDYRWACGKLDVGRMEFDGDDLMEYGVHKFYEEIWKRKGPLGKEVIALERLHDGSANEKRGFLILVDDRFTFASATPRAFEEGVSFTQLVENNELSREELIELLNFEISYGDIASDTGSLNIQHSTIPFREGKSLLQAEQLELIKGAGSVGTVVDIEAADAQDPAAGRWKVLEWSDNIFS